MDYILLLKVLSEKTKLAVNENEISAMGWVTRDNITEFVESKKKMVRLLKQHDFFSNVYSS